MEQKEVIYAVVDDDRVFVTKDEDRVSLIDFFTTILPHRQEGWLALGYMPDIKLRPKDYSQAFVYWLPALAYLDLFEDIFDFVDSYKAQDCYFSPLLFREQKRTKQYAQPGSVLWADLDECKPGWLGKYGEPPPNILVRTSADHWQAYWLLDEIIPAERIEQLNKNIVYGYRREGVDFGWTRTKIMRIPTTHNNKKNEPFKVEAYITKTSRAKVTDFDGLPQAKRTGDIYTRVSFGGKTITPADVDKLPIANDIKELIHHPPEKGGRSEACFKVIKALHQAGLTPDEIKAIMKANPIGERYYG